MELEILDNTKMLLEISDEKCDGLLAFLIKDIIEAVKSYCRLPILPNQLSGLIARMAADAYGKYEDGNAANGIKSITEGQRRVEFTEKGFDEYTQRLKPYINKAARLPSEMKAEAAK